MTDELAQLVAAHPLFRDIPDAMAALVAGCAHNEAFSAGERLLVEGDEADTFYLLRRGRIALEVHAPGRGSLVIETLQPGAAVGWSWLFPPYRWHSDARALEPVGVIAVDARCLRAKADADPAFGYVLMQRLSEVMLDRLQATQLRLLDLYGDVHTV
jgi:CRP/FNR family cyclic AMP-dependent transcriptional regulator